MRRIMGVLSLLRLDSNEKHAPALARLRKDGKEPRSTQQIGNDVGNQSCLDALRATLLNFDGQLIDDTFDARDAGRHLGSGLFLMRLGDRSGQCAFTTRDGD